MKRIAMLVTLVFALGPLAGCAHDKKTPTLMPSLEEGPLPPYNIFNQTPFDDPCPATMTQMIYRDFTSGNWEEGERKLIHLLTSDYVQRKARPGDAEAILAVRANYQLGLAYLETDLALSTKSFAIINDIALRIAPARACDDLWEIQLLDGLAFARMGELETAILFAWTGGHDHPHAVEAWLGSAFLYKLVGRDLSAKDALERAGELLSCECAPLRSHTQKSVRPDYSWPSGGLIPCPHHSQCPIDSQLQG